MLSFRIQIKVVQKTELSKKRFQGAMYH